MPRRVFLTWIMIGLSIWALSIASAYLYILLNTTQQSQEPLLNQSQPSPKIYTHTENKEKYTKEKYTKENQYRKRNTRDSTSSSVQTTKNRKGY